ncbi:MAG: hypothetical protein AAB539_04760 [Patescibacteria group bacterium]
MSKKTAAIVTIAFTLLLVVGIATLLNQSRRAKNNGGASGSDANPSPVALTAPDANRMSRAELTALIDANPDDGTLTEITAYTQKVADVAVRASTIDITGCVPSPTVARLALGERIMVKNNDATEHTLNLSIDRAYPIPANSADSFSFDIDAEGVYSYACDGAFPAGIFYVVRQAP